MMKNESGRSMVEMLGVLAIIGVLSVGGIAGYTMAMRKYRANELANAVSMTFIAATTDGAAATYTGKYTTFPNGMSPVTNVQVTPASGTDKTAVKIIGPSSKDACDFCGAFEDSLGSPKKIGNEEVTISYGAS